MRRLLYLVPLAAFVAVAIWFAVGLTRDPSRIPSALIDQPIPAFTLPAVAGTSVPGLSDQAIKGKVALVNVFASWCVPCKAEHPILMRLAAENRVPIYGLNWKDRSDDASRWLKELGNPYAAIGHDESGRVAIDWGVYGAPETFLIDREGRIRFKQVGPITPAVLRDTILPLIARLEQ
jgi:cytochrome c biogenesis protein CcmG/thiol:disulfide interchange protein DsbE